MVTTLVHQTDNHDWYTIRYRKHWAITHTLLFNIVLKDDKPPTDGYFSPLVPMNKNGYNDLKVSQTFIKSNCK